MKLGETTLALIRVPIVIRDSATGLPAAGCVPVGAQLSVSRTAAGWTAATGTLVDDGDGFYYYQGTAPDASVEGFLAVKVEGVAGYTTEVAWAPVFGPSNRIWIPYSVRDAGGTLLAGLAFGVDVTQTMSLNGAAFVAPTGTNFEIGSGTYFYAHDVVGVSGFVAIKVVSAGVAIEGVSAWGSIDDAGIGTTAALLPSVAGATSEGGGIGIYGVLRKTAAQLGELIGTLLRFDEEDASGDMLPARDACLGLDDMSAPAGCNMPTKTTGLVGRAAVFVSGAANGIQAKDAIVGGTLFQRDATIQTLISLDVATQHAFAGAGTIIARGLGTGPTEYQALGLEYVVNDVATRSVTVRWVWHNTGGGLVTDGGATFFAPPLGTFFLLTATRHWVSPTAMVLRYYVNDQLVAESLPGVGDIAGAVDATTTIGTRYSGGAYHNFLAAYVDELALANFEMCREEIEATWFRISRYQPDGYRQMRDLMPPGLPISDDPASRVQSDLRAMGTALGFADGMIENVRANTMPDRAYGETLRRWEGITGVPSKPTDSLDARRARVLGQLAKRGGVSPDGVRQALAELLDTDGANLEILAFDNTIRDAFATIAAERWRTSAGWDAIGGEMRVQAAAGSYPWNETAPAGGLSAVVATEAPRGLGHPINGLQLIASLNPHALPAGSEVGIVFWNWAASHALFFGLRNTGGVYSVGYQRIEAGAATDAVWQVIAVSALAKHWLRIQPTVTPAVVGISDHAYDLGWSTVGDADAGLATTQVIFKRDIGWAGFYFRTHAAYAGGVDARFGDFALRNTKGTRPYYWYVFRDPGLGGAPDITGANMVVRRMRHAFTKAAVITSKSLLTDDPGSLTDTGPMGAL